MSSKPLRIDNPTALALDRNPDRHFKRWRPTSPKRLFSNFAVLGTAEIFCRGISILVTLSLMKRLKPEGYGKIELAFSIVFWLVLIVRDFFETIITRELSRKPALTKLLVNRVIAVKFGIAIVLYLGLVAVSLITFADLNDRLLLWTYGFLLFSTSLGLDFVYRGSERVGLVAISLTLRTLFYSLGVWFTVYNVDRLQWVPAWLVGGEVVGITYIWSAYAAKYGFPKPRFDRKFLWVMLHRGRSVCLIHLSQTIVISADLMVVGIFDNWADVGRYGAPLRMITAAMAFGFIFQQVVFPSLARSRRLPSEAGQRLINELVRILLTAFIPIAIGTSLLSESLVRFLFPIEFHDCGLLLAVGIWRAPLLCLAFLYQSSLIAMNRESSGVRLLVSGALISFPLIALLRWEFGLIGASSAVLVIGAGLAAAGFLTHLQVGRQPAWHHHLKSPLLASMAMIPVCLALVHFHVIAAVVGGALVYSATLYILGGFDFRSWSIEPNANTKAFVPSPPSALATVALDSGT